jgi:hypothetical protein
MDLENYLPERFQEGLQRDIFFIVVSLLIVASAAGVTNLLTPEGSVEVGLTEIHTECVGIDAGVCLGLEQRSHTTYNYDNYTEAEPGEPNYYRRVESELMAQAYNICESENVTEYEWASEAEYENKTGSEWRQMDEVQLLPCEETYWRDLDAEG